VKTAAASHGSSEKIRATSLRSLYFIAAATPEALNPFAAQTPPFMNLTFFIE
jgi:hypothetical protein